MDAMLVRLKPFDPRRGHVLRRFTYAGIKFHEERGWYRVDKAVADYLRTVREVPGSELSPPAFDVCTEDEAKALDTREETEARVRKSATEAATFTAARAESAVTTADLARPSARPPDTRGKRG